MRWVTSGMLKKKGREEMKKGKKEKKRSFGRGIRTAFVWRNKANFIMTCFQVTTELTGTNFLTIRNSFPNDDDSTFSNHPHYSLIFFFFLFFSHFTKTFLSSPFFSLLFLSFRSFFPSFLLSFLLPFSVRNWLSSPVET